jgi:hypothetical protein
VVAQNLATSPTWPLAEQIYYDVTGLFTLRWTGSAWIDRRAWASHSGTQIAATISNLTETRQACRVGMLALSAAGLAMDGFTSGGPR